MDQLKFPVTLLSYNVGSQFNVSSCVFVFGPCPYIDWICSGHVLSHVSRMTVQCMHITKTAFVFIDV